MHQSPRSTALDLRGFNSSGLVIVHVRPLNNLGDWSTMFVRHLQFSTLELIAATTVIGLLMASAVIDGLLSTIAIVVAALFFWGCLIVAFIGRGYERVNPRSWFRFVLHVVTF